MYDIFLPIGEAHLDPWRSHRLFSACRTFSQHVDSDASAQAVSVDHRRHGWTFSLSNTDARAQLALFYDRLHAKVLAEQPSRAHPVEVGGWDAAAAIYAG